MNELDVQMAEAADFLAGKFVADNDVIAAHELDRARLDFSLESLKVVDAWLPHLRDRSVDPDTEEGAQTIICAGAYVGEVIRRSATRRYHWLSYEDYMANKPEGTRNAIPFTFGTQFILAYESGMTLPVNKVCRWLAEGPEHNLYFYASAR